MGRIKKPGSDPHQHAMRGRLNSRNISLLIKRMPKNCRKPQVINLCCVIYYTYRSYVINNYFCRFPSELTLRNMWLKNMKALTWTPKETDSLCSKHFDTKCFITHNTRTALKSDSVPTLFEGLFESK